MQRRTRAFVIAVAVVSVLGTRPLGVAAHEGGRRHGRQGDTTGPDECLVGIHDSSGALSPGETLCQTASGHVCTFNLQLCLNQAGCAPADFGAHTVRASGHCGPVGQLRVQGAGTGSVCGAFTGVHVHTASSGKAPGRCTIRAAVRSAKVGARTDVDTVNLVCMPPGAQCPNSTTTTTVATTTTTTSPIPTTTTTASTTSTTAASTTTTTAGGTTSTTAGATTSTTVGATTSTTAGATTTTTVGATTTTTTGATTTTTVGATTSTTGATTTTTAATTSTTSSTVAPTTTTSTVVSTTTTTLGTCAPVVIDKPIANTYLLQGTTGEKRCTTNAASNRFGACASDTDCGGTVGACMQLPWVTADGQIMPFPTGTSTLFVVSQAAAFPGCEHETCIPCGNPNAACAGIPGCEVAGNPNGCIPRATMGCCDQPGFIVPTFFVNILGGLCSRVDQIDCGLGVINTSNPQTGDNEVTKNADTSDPGPDCLYGTPDDPAHKACTATGEGNDYNGKIVSTIGNGSHDANGIQYRLTTPELSTTWTDGQSPAGTCANGSKYDDGELLVSQLILKAQPTTAGATGSFVDMNGDGCKRAGSGFIAPTNAATDGPITVGPSPGPLKPQPYDGSSGSVSGAVSEVFSGPNSPIRDIGFVAITPQMPIVTAPAVSCSCTVTPGCPE